MSVRDDWDEYMQGMTGVSVRNDYRIQNSLLTKLTEE